MNTAMLTDPSSGIGSQRAGNKFSNQLKINTEEEIKEEIDRDGVMRSPTGNEMIDPLIMSQDESALRTVNANPIDLSATGIGTNLAQMTTHGTAPVTDLIKSAKAQGLTKGTKQLTARDSENMTA